MTGPSWPDTVFERLYGEQADPWGFETSPYEQAKYAETLRALPNRRFSNALECGCSIGVMTEALAARCDALLGVDVAEAALVRARSRCATLPHVTFARKRLPEELPEGRFDLIVISEVLYFLSAADIGRLAAAVAQRVVQDGIVLLANWTGGTDTPCTGDEAAERFIPASQAAGLRVTLAARHEGYRLDRLDR